MDFTLKTVMGIGADFTQFLINLLLLYQIHTLRKQIKKQNIDIEKLKKERNKKGRINIRAYTIVTRNTDGSFNQPEHFGGKEELEDKIINPLVEAYKRYEKAMKEKSIKSY